MSQIKVQNEREVIEAIQKYANAMERSMESVIKETAISIEGDAVRLIQRPPKTGKVYKRKTKAGNTIVHQASAPGEAPSSDEGILAANIRSLVVDRLGGGVDAYIGTDLDYGAFLEHGTQHISERPWLRPAREMNVKKFFEKAKRRLGKL